MSFSECITIRNNKKLEWEKDFEKNYKQAANHIAQRFANDCFALLVQSVSNPYKTLYSAERKYVASLFFDMTFRCYPLSLHQYLEETKLPPFIEWVNESINVSNKEYDHGYFVRLMDMVGKAALAVLQLTCKQLAATCIIEGNKLNFEAKYDSNSVCMSLFFWFDSATLPYQSIIIKNEEKV